MASAGGFFFDFGDDATPPPPPPAPAVHGQAEDAPVPDLPMAAFPWTCLDGPQRQSQLAMWARAYPSSESQPLATMTKPLQLTFSRPHPAAAITVCYQTAPELPALTRATEPHEKGTASATVPSPTPPSSHESKWEGRDIVQGKYYGGLKVWSCAPDLGQYLAEHAHEWPHLFPPPPHATSSPASSAPVVVEVGCGQGIPGLAAIALGARRVIFMDYNEEVLDTCTRPNVAASILSAEAAPGGSHLAPHVQLVAGDWERLQWDTAVDPAGCDLILGTDVTFDEVACAKLALLLSRWLKPQTGVAYIASKVFYFGTGGGAEELTVSCRRYGLEVDVVKRMEADGGMRRLILRVQKPLGSSVASEQC